MLSSSANVGRSNEVGALISCSANIMRVDVASGVSRQFSLYAHDKARRVMSVEVEAVAADVKKKHQASRKTTSEKTTAVVKKPDHPSYADMIKQALIALKERGGSSRQAILKYLMANFKLVADENAVNTRLKAALRNGVKSELLKQSTGSGASGSFRLGVDAVKKEKKLPAAVVQQEKVVVAKPKRTGKLVAVEAVKKNIKKTAKKAAATTTDVGGTKSGKKKTPVMKMEVKKQQVAKPKRAKVSPAKKKAVPLAAAKKPSTKTRSAKK